MESAVSPQCQLQVLLYLSLNGGNSFQQSEPVLSIFTCTSQQFEMRICHEGLSIY